MRERSLGTKALILPKYIAGTRNRAASAARMAVKGWRNANRNNTNAVAMGKRILPAVPRAAEVASFLD